MGAIAAIATIVTIGGPPIVTIYPIVSTPPIPPPIGKTKKTELNEFINT